MRHQRSIDQEIDTLMTLLNRLAPDNIAPIPVSLWQEDGQWNVAIHVRVRRVTEYEVMGFGVTLSDAITNARRSLANEARNNQQSKRNAETFGYQV